MSVRLSTLAPAKVNLGLFLGPPREHDGRHELVTVMQSVSLADAVTLEAGEEASTAGEDEVICPGLPGPADENLAAAALAAFRSASGWSAGPLRLRIDKRIPLAAGLAGGSADAAATLRLAAEASGLGNRDLLLSLAAGLGADVSAQLQPGRWLAGGAGETLSELPSPRQEICMLLLPGEEGLATSSVYAEADRLRLARPMSELEQRAARLREELDLGAALPASPELLHNDLERAAISLCPAIEQALAQVREAGAELAFVSGSGPTAVGVFSGAGARSAIARAQELLRSRRPATIACTPVNAAAGAIGDAG
jgi:4-diphosphocytidyl-2-C-methyl-D-erythritol kinase